MLHRICHIILCIALGAFSSCNKSSFLSAKSDERLISPTKLSDFRQLLDNVNVMNGFGTGLVPGIGEASADDYYVNESLFNSDLATNPIQSKLYTWKDGIFDNPDQKPEDWGFPYRCIFYSNLVINELTKIVPNPAQQKEYSELLGSAHFFRAHMYYQLSQIFSPIIDEKNLVGNEFGVILKLSSNINETNKRSKVTDVYRQIIDDLQKAKDLLPDSVIFNTRPSKPAVYGLLSRVYLTMGKYEDALESAENCLKYKHELLDYNNISTSDFFPFVRTNKEIIFYSLLNYVQLDVLSFYYSRVDSSLYDSYSDDDLRKALFFESASTMLGIPDDNGFFFRGSYDGTDKYFAGIAVDEILFIAAECKARLERITEAMNDLNYVIQLRWNKNANYVPFVAGTTEEALHIILSERRKELVMRGLRWTDIRRLNREGANISLQRSIGGNNYILSPTSLQYTVLIPNEVITANPGMMQNPR